MIVFQKETQIPDSYRPFSPFVAFLAQKRPVSDMTLIYPSFLILL
ncbi:hypothetical protein CAL7102_05944 [Dulcicalothrix desertica PCC 7102]|nr:hypothetical protein CAL7102_05944 [Dulcicalothrix desertica PCC 7102]